MTVASETSRWAYNGDGSTTAFPYTTKIFAKTDLLVYVGGVLKTVDTDYTVSGPFPSASGNVTFVVAPIVGTGNVVIVKAIPNKQDSSFPLGGPMPTTAIETALDKATMQIQQVNSKVTRSMRQMDSDAVDIAAIPVKATRASKLLGFDSNGDPTVTTNTLTALDSSTSAAVASAAAAAASASTASGAATAASASAVSAAASAATASGAVGGLKISSGDTTADKLILKLLAGTGVSLTKGNAGANETLTAAVDIVDLTAKASPTTSDLLMIGDAAASNVPKQSTIAQVLALVAGVATGVVAPFVGRTAPSGYLLCDGSAVSRAAFAALYAVMCPSIGTFTVTLATPAVFTLSAHGLSIGERVRFTTTGALPTGLTANTDYFISNVPSSSTFRVSASLGGADVNTSVSQSGTHTGQYFGYGAGDGSTTFNVPDMRGRVAAGADAMGGTAQSRLTLSGSGISAGGMGVAGGTETTTLTTAQLASHSHTQNVSTLLQTGSGTSVGTACPNNSISLGGTTATNGSGTAHQNTQPTITTNYIIKT